MRHGDLSVWLDAYRQPAKAALQAAAHDGFRRLDVNVLAGDLAPEQLSASGRRHLRRYLADLGLSLAGFATEFPGAGLADAEAAEARLARVRAALELCQSLGVQRLGTTVGGFDAGAGRGLGGAMLAELADLADRAGIDITVQVVGSDSTTALRQLAALGCPHLAGRLDTASLLQTPDTAAQAAAVIRDVQLRDARRSGGAVEEVAFGEGDVDFRDLFAMLSATDRPIDYVIRRNSPTGVDALRRGREYIAALRGGDSAAG